MANETRTIRDEDMFSGTEFSVYSGREVTGWPTMTIRRGEVVYEGGDIVAEAGSGERCGGDGGRRRSAHA